jgi:uncharacterized membrane protein
LWTVALIGYYTSLNYFLAIVGITFALFSGYLIVPRDWKQKSVLKYLKKNKITRFAKLLGWYTVLWIFGARLVQTKVIWLIVIGIITIIIAVIVLYVGLWRAGTDYRERKEQEVQSMGSKGRKNIKKPKLTKEQKETKKKGKK